jgi:outer membrane protein OmpA-like peptidoglycan-associated protein
MMPAEEKPLTPPQGEAVGSPQQLPGGLAQPAATPPEVASLPAPTPQEPSTGMPNVLASVLFTAEQTDVPSAEETKLKAVVAQMNQDPSVRINIISYASSADGQNSSARRVSLKRALAVRKYFIGAGLDGTRINVQAMGSSGEGSKDRVDILRLGNS